ncbi:unnamed protein product [Acanthoscelides obtectus]|uniref:Inosine/uridine-preferring nucleoside hydrolase domain-containing protein n=1 Tax=Acanthoscelides obtectus TaxID=200917 RepID=A0A9P0JWL8_ACAOB|nr:unnamed protein product [Acanthoscelides obtectus]CAK1648903.1 Probable uridine nucleosidase 2 [Acanthoscelides obtectus]
MGRGRIVVDVDAGLDDYVALLIFLHADKLGDIKVEGIICTNGNTTRENVVRNVIRLLELVGRTDIPVYKGAQEQFILHRKPFILHQPPLYQYHGQDGFGDMKHDTDPDVSLVKDTPASFALSDLVLSAPHQISVICLGPLTTLALTLKLFPELAGKIKDVWIMGGNIRGVGNITSSAEFNFYMDPEAVHIVLECLKCEIYILPWEPCSTVLISKVFL